MGYGPNVCTGGTPSASSELYGAASLAFDGDSGTFWCSGSAYPHWLKYDFGEGNEKVVTMLRLQARSTVYNPFHMLDYQGSNDDSNWDTISSYDHNLTFSNGKWVTLIDFTNTTAYRYYRLYMTEGPTGYAELAECRMYEDDGYIKVTQEATPTVSSNWWLAD